MQGMRLALYLKGVGFIYKTDAKWSRTSGLGFPSYIVPILEILRCHSLRTRPTVLKGMNFAVAWTCRDSVAVACRYGFPVARPCNHHFSVACTCHLPVAWTGHTPFGGWTESVGANLPRSFSIRR